MPLGGNTGSGGARDPKVSLSNALARLGGAGIDAVVPDKVQDFAGQAASVTGTGLLTALDWLNRPSQAVLRGIQNRDSGPGGILRGIGQGITGGTDGAFHTRAADTTNLRGAIITPQLAGPDDERRKSGEAEHFAENVGGRALGAVDFLGTALLDPTTYLGVGAVGKAGKVGAESAAKTLQATAPELAEKVTATAGKQAIKKSLTPQELDTVKSAIMASDEAQIAKGGAEKFADKAIAQLNQPAGVRFAGQTVLRADDQIKPVTDALRLTSQTAPDGTIIQKGLGGAIADSRIVEGVGQAIKPRTDVARNFGNDAANQVNDLVNRTDASASNATNDVIQNVNRLSASAKLTRQEDDQFGDLLNQGRQAVDDHIEGLRTTGQGEKADLLTYLRDIRVPLQNRSQSEQLGLLDAPSGSAVNGFQSAALPDALTKAGRNAVKNNAPTIARRMGVDQSVIDNMARTGALAPNIDREAFTAAAREAARTSDDIIETSARSTTVNAVQNNAQDAARTSLYKGLLDIPDAEGVPLASLEPKPGYAKVQLPDKSEIYVPGEIKTELSRAQAVMLNDQSMKKFGQLMTKWNTLWRAYATVPLIGGVGFHARNALGNMFNNMLAGVANPDVYRQAFKLQKAINDARKTGQPFEEAIGKQGLSEREVKIVTEARRRGTIGDFIVQADQALDPTVRGTSARERITEGINPLSRRNVAIRSGTWVGQQVETNARLALFLDSVNKTGSFEQANRTVQKYLFDYGDLTAFENKVMRNAMPFYTYMRKNTPLQFEQLVQQPGKYTALANFYNQLAISGGDVNGKSIPEYVLENGAVPIDVPFTDDPMMVSLSTPFDAAIKVAKPVTETAGALAGIKGLTPSGGREQIARDWVNMLGGAPAEVVKFGIGQATGRDLFTGQDISKESGGQTALRGLKALSPGVGKITSTSKDVAGSKDERISKALDALTGANATAITDKRSTGETYRQLEIANKAIASAKAQGREVPTTGDLRKAGVLPKAKRKAAKTKTTRAKKVSVKKVKVTKAKTVKPRSLKAPKAK